MARYQPLLGALVLLVGASCVGEVPAGDDRPGGDDPPAQDAAPAADAGDVEEDEQEVDTGPISCVETTDEGATWYDGPSASDLYDDTFTGGPALAGSFLDARVPQGLGTWSNWNGTGADLLVYAGYKAGGVSWVQGVDAATGAVTRIAHIPESHVGGVAIVPPWAFISGPSNTVDRYDLSALRAVFDGTVTAPAITARASLDVFAASFLAADGDSLFAGKFNETARDSMYRYRVETDGTLTELEGPIEVPVKTQGLAVSADHYYFSTSYGRDKRSNLYVAERDAVLNAATVSCFRAPSMSEGITIHDGNVFVLFESGSFEYRATARNAIAHLHRTTQASLVGLMAP